MESMAGARVWCRVRAALRTRAAAAVEEDADTGFTLIELMVVLLILAILLAIAIPTFLDTTNVANDTSAMSNLHNEMLTAKALFTQQEGYDTTPNVVSGLNTSNATLTAIPGDSDAINVISVATYESDGTTASTGPDDGVILVLAAYSPKTTTCWFGVDNASTDATAAPPGTHWGSFPTADPTTCKGSEFAIGGGPLQVQS